MSRLGASDELSPALKAIYARMRSEFASVPGVMQMQPETKASQQPTMGGETSHMRSKTTDENDAGVSAMQFDGGFDNTDMYDGDPGSPPMEDSGAYDESDAW
jgi:hypothetical protein